MIERGKGDLLRAQVDALVNTVNTQGVMGKGIALQFKKAFPENFKAYHKACKAGEVVLGKMFVFDLGTLIPRYVINFPTKKHWRNPSRLADIESGLRDLTKQIALLKIRSIALPPLGCGLGGLQWGEVKPLIERELSGLTDVRIVLFEPKGAPAPEQMVNRTARPRMTPGRAALLASMDRYAVPGYDYRLSLLEVQKLAYFLQEAGEPLRLNYVAHHYGPYSDTLRHVLSALEGHYTIGYGAGEVAPETPVKLLPGASEAATQFLESKPKTHERLEAVSRLIEGFETPYGMELLATVHWVAKHSEAVTDAETATTAVHDWSSRKAKTMLPEQIAAAWDRLRAQGWLDLTAPRS